MFAVLREKGDVGKTEGGHAMSDIYFTVKTLGALLETVFYGVGILIAGAGTVAVASVMKRRRDYD